MMAKIGIDARLWNESGVGRYIRNLISKFDESELKSDIYVYLLENDFQSLVFRNNRIHKRKANVRWHTVSEQLKLKFILEKDELDLVHFPYFSYPIFYSKPFVITIHDLIIDHYPTGIASSLPFPLYQIKLNGYRKVISTAIEKSKKIIVPSHATYDEIQTLYRPKSSKIEVIYEGFDSAIMKGKNPKKLISTNYILYVGNAYPHKNLDRLIEAYKFVRRKHKVDLVLIGRDDYFYNKIDTKVDGLKVLHDVDDLTLFEYYTNARLFVMPSLMEGFGLPLLEAMSLSCPIVSSDTKALKEIGKDACIYFDPLSVEDIASKINLMLDGKVNVSELIKKGKSRAKSFSWEECASKTLALYESCNSI